MTTDRQAPFTARKVGSSGHEILDPGGSVVAWTVDGYWADIIVALLNRVEQVGLSSDCHHAASGGMVALEIVAAGKEHNAGQA